MGRRQIPVGRCTKCGAPAYNAAQSTNPGGRTKREDIWLSLEARWMRLNFSGWSIETAVNPALHSDKCVRSEPFNVAEKCTLLSSKERDGRLHFGHRAYEFRSRTTTVVIWSLVRESLFSSPLRSTSEPSGPDIRLKPSQCHRSSENVVF
jgi:hypothetical protein